MEKSNKFKFNGMFVVGLIVFIAWTIFVLTKYLKFHPEYLSSLKNSPGLFTNFIITFAIFYGGYYFFRQSNSKSNQVYFKKSPFNMICIGGVGLLLIATIMFSKTHTLNGTNITYPLAIWNMIAKAIPVFVTMFATLFLSFILGDSISRLLKINWQEDKKGIVNISVGLATIMQFVFFLGIFSSLNKVGIYSLALGILILCYKSYTPFIDWLFARNKESEEVTFFSVDTALYIVLYYFISINIIDVMRPMPIGWDDMGVYLNYPKKIAEDGSAFHGGGVLYYYLSSIAFVIWPKYVADMVGLFYSWFGGILGVTALYVFIKRFFSAKMAIFAATCYYIMPMITFQSALDLKHDPALFLFMTSSALVLFDKSVGLLSKIKELTHRISKEDKVKWGVGGYLIAAAFLIKITTSMEVFSFIALCTFFIFNWRTAVGVIFLETALFLAGFAQIPEFSRSLTMTLAASSAIIGIIIVLTSKITKNSLIHFKDVAVYGITGFMVLFLPWAIFNYNDSRQLTFDGIVSGKFNELVSVDYAKLGIDPKGADKSYCEITSNKEELGRYIGYDQPFFKKYFTLPWKNTMNTESGGYYLDIGFLYLAIIPGIFLIGIWRKWTKLEWGILVLFCVNWFFWMFSAQGVPWYGLFGFLPAIILVGMVLYDKHMNETYLKYIFTLIILFALILPGFLRETKTLNTTTVKYVFGGMQSSEVIDTIVPSYRKIVDVVAEESNANDQIKQLLLDSFINQFSRDYNKEHGKNPSKEELMAYYTKVSELYTPISIPPRSKENPNYLYRVGTFIPYFVKNDRRIMVTDSQLDIFKCIDGDQKDDARTLKRLKDLGFRYIVYDTNTDTIERNPEGTLHKKVKRFLEFATNLKTIYLNKNGGIAFFVIDK